MSFRLLRGSNGYTNILKQAQCQTLCEVARVFCLLCELEKQEGS